MKIGFYSPYIDTFGGGERYMLTLASHLASNNDVDVFWDDKSIKAPIARFLKIDLSKTNFTTNIFSQNFLKKLILTKRYDHIFVLSDGSIPSTFARNNILHFQVPFKNIDLSVSEKLKLKKYKHIICNSNFTKKFIDKTYSVNSRVIYPPVAVDQIRSGEKENIILSVGRFSENQLHPKRQAVLIEVFKELYKRTPNWKLILVGQAKKEDLKYLRKLKNSIRGFAITILENESAQKLRNLYSKSRVYWHATGFGGDENKNPEKMEHFGIATVEAQAAGAVPVVIKRGGQKEIVEDKKNGLLWETKSELLEKTLSLITDRNTLEHLSEEAIKNSKRFSQEIFFKNFDEILK